MPLSYLRLLIVLAPCAYHCNSAVSINCDEPVEEEKWKRRETSICVYAYLVHDTMYVLTAFIVRCFGTV